MGRVKRHVQIAAGYFMTIHEMEVKDGAGMYAGEEGGRACGTIAKVKNYRAKRKGRSGYNV